jgi:ABC-2 type transport system permease protein
MSTHQNLGLTDAAAIRLVAGRELGTRLRSKAFQVVTLILALVIIAICVILGATSGPASATKVGYVPAAQGQAAPLKAISASLGESVDTVAVPDEATGKQQVSAGTLDALLDGDGTSVVVVVPKDIDGGLQNAVNVLAGQVALQRQITDLHGDPATVMQAQATAKAAVRPLQAPFPYQVQDLVLGIVAGVLVYMSLMINGQSVAQGVVEEKSSRVVELLLATIRPWQLMAGKVLGIGLVGLIQILVIGVAGVVAGLATGVLTISVTAAVGTVVWLIVWFLLGFFMYAIVLAGVGALVSRQEDAGTVVFPALIPLIAGYVMSVSILPADPGSKLIEVLSVIPLFAPTMMPMRLAMGGVPVWEPILAVVLTLALIPLLVWGAGRIYRNAVLRTGARVSLKQALRPA